MDAMQRSDSDKCLEAMKFEMESMKVNDARVGNSVSKPIVNLLTVVLFLVLVYNI